MTPITKNHHVDSSYRLGRVRNTVRHLTEHLRQASARWPLVANQLFAACSVSNASIYFGSYNPLTFPGKSISSDVLATATMAVNCITDKNKTVDYIAKLSGGSSNKVGARSMHGSAGGNNMNYNLYTDFNRTIVWGGDAGGNALGGSYIDGKGPSTIIIYGRIPGGQSSIYAGTYSDALVITLQYQP